MKTILPIQMDRKRPEWESRHRRAGEVAETSRLPVTTRAPASRFVDCAHLSLDLSHKGYSRLVSQHTKECQRPPEVPYLLYFNSDHGLMKFQDFLSEASVAVRALGAALLHFSHFPSFSTKTGPGWQGRPG